ncbi:MAG: PAS domain-containing protein [Steroidobacteraceae bacterium]|nr:PAS domain-containing protein [Deltaproteobacteria bacterium]
MKSRTTNHKNLYLCGIVIAIILTISAGWMLTDFLGRIAEKEFKERVSREANLIVAYLNNSLGDVENAAKALNRADQVVAALSSGSPADLERANALFDRVNSGLELSICYLLDRNGLTVASSNRNEKTSFVGKSFAFRPFVKGALAGRLSTYFALGLLTRKRGYFAAMPVVDSHGIIIGAVVVKRNIAPLGEIFRKYTHAFLVNPDGIIFISSSDKLLYRSLWPVAERRRSELLASKQFGDITFEPLLSAEPRTGEYVRFDNSEHYVQRLPIGQDGWSLVSLVEPDIVSNYRMFGILLTIVFGVMLLFFYFVVRHKEESLEATVKLLKAKDDWKRTFDAVPDLIAIIDSKCRISSMNEAMAARLGISPQEAVGRRCFELLHGSQVPPPSCPHRRMLDTGRTESAALFDKNLNGDFIVTAAPILAENGTIESSIHVMHDVSELRRMELSLKEYAQRLEFVLEGSNDASFEWDMIADQCILNTRYYEMTGYTPGEVDASFAFFISTIHPEDASEVQRRVQEHLEGKTGEYEAQYRMVTKSGQIRHVMGRAKVVRRDEDGRPLRMAGVITDITEQKKLHDEVNRISNLASIGLLAGGLAHDFNNVLNIIYGNISFARMLAGDNPAIVEPLADAEEACERAKELGVRLQAFSQGSSPAKTSIALPALLEDAAEAVFKDSNILHSLSAAVDILPAAADPRQIRQVFENLLTNAREALPDGGTVGICIENCAVNGNSGLPLGSGRYVSITIQDDGQGIPEENLSKIFDPYFSTKDTYSQRGMGLGLSICHAILKRHSGHITVESKSGIGTRVTVYLPVSVEETRPAPEG